MKINYCDALVIGGGLAGLRAAVAAQKKGLNTCIETSITGSTYLPVSLASGLHIVLIQYGV